MVAFEERVGFVKMARLNVDGRTGETVRPETTVERWVFEERDRVSIQQEMTDAKGGEANPSAPSPIIWQRAARKPTGQTPANRRRLPTKVNL
jgi:hypothetical protein